jgi:hypothetical protein
MPGSTNTTTVLNAKAVPIFRDREKCLPVRTCQAIGTSYRSATNVAITSPPILPRPASRYHRNDIAYDGEHSLVLFSIRYMAAVDPIGGRSHFFDGRGDALGSIYREYSWSVITFLI